MNLWYRYAPHATPVEVKYLCRLSPKGMYHRVQQIRSGWILGVPAGSLYRDKLGTQQLNAQLLMLMFGDGA